MALNPPVISRYFNYNIILEMYRFLSDHRHGKFSGSPRVWEQTGSLTAPGDAAGCLPSASYPKFDLTIRKIAKLFA